MNTAGYVREVVNQQSMAVGGQGIGVSVADIARTTNAYLEAANQKATADGANASVSSSYLDQASSLFGDPTSPASFFGQLDNVFSAFTTPGAGGSPFRTSKQPWRLVSCSGPTRSSSPAPSSPLSMA